MFKYRNREASDIRKQNSGVPLGSATIEREYLKQEQQKLVDDDKMTDWRMFRYVAMAVFLLHGVLQLSVTERGIPYEPTVYVPYEPPSSSAAASKKLSL